MRTMRKIVAIGGGEIGRPGYPVETMEINQEILRLAGKESPRLLFLPTATWDSPTYISAVENHFGGRLKCCVDSLCLVQEAISQEVIRSKILSSDIVYVGGGDTSFLLETWREQHVDAVLEEACASGVVLSGLSAGSICWFEYGVGDERKEGTDQATLATIEGLGLISGGHCPHYGEESYTRENIAELTRNRTTPMIALENACALEVVGDEYRIIRSNQTANAYKMFWKNEDLVERLIEKKEGFQDLGALLTDEGFSTV